jgi:glycosyltransferase involved in cell wall biosynthesis
MRIAIDINGIDQTSGLGNYLRLLINNLAALDHENEYLLYSHCWAGPPATTGLDLPTDGNFRFISHKIPETLTLLSEYKFAVNMTECLLADHKIDVFHGPGNIVPRLKKIRSVLTTQHHLPASSPFFPQNLNWRERFYWQCMVYSIKSADHIICSSESTRSDVAKLLDSKTDKASVIYPGGPDSSYRVLAKENPAVRQKYGLPQEFLLFVGPVQERKNLPRLLNALKLAENKLGGHKLVITGISSQYYPAVIQAHIKKLGLTDRVVVCGSVDKADMPWLYNMATALIYPSLFEGFGYPVLEAFLCGCPVAASTATSIPELTGDAAVLFDPLDEKRMAESLLAISYEPELREKLVAKGFIQANKFSWQETVKQTIEVYKQVNSLK